MAVNIIKDIESINFGLLSSDEIKKLSVCKIHNTKMKGPGTVYDERMGPDPQINSPCVTCGETIELCPGHFGHIELAESIIHPLYYKMVLDILRCVCTKCNRLLLNEDLIKLYDLNLLESKIRFNAIIEKIEKVDVCTHCENPHPKIIHSTKENIYTKIHKDTEKKCHSTILTVKEIKRIFDNIPDEDVELMGFNIKLTHPKNMILTCLPVLPPCARPFIFADGNMCDDDLTNQMCEIIKPNNILQKEGISEIEKTKALQSLKFRIQTLFDNSKGRATHTTNSRAIKGIKERLSGKDGLIRQNLLGKRCNQSSRTVIGPDPTLKIDELGVPDKVADTLTYPERITKYNIEKMTKLVNEGGANFVINNNNRKINLKYALYKIGTILQYGDIVLRGKIKIKIDNKKKIKLQQGDKIIRNEKILENIEYPEKKTYNLQIGNIVYRKLQNGDYVLLNRQPTLHKGSMMAMRIKRLPGKTFRMNLSVCGSFNADFDGDEMNIHAPQSLEAVAELVELSSSVHNIISPQGGQCNITIVQDSLLAAYKMTKGIQEISKGNFYQMCNFLDMTYITKKLRHIKKVLNNDLEISTSKILWYNEKEKKYYENRRKNTKKVIKEIFTGKMLFSMLLPDDFNFVGKNDADPNEPILKIKKGVVYEGAVNKKNLKSSHCCITLLLLKEYNLKTATDFVDNVQFLTNNWLLLTGFSIGISDCIATKKNDIEDILEKCYIEADEIEKMTMHSGIREIRIANSLNKARDVGLRIAKDGLSSDNSFKDTVLSGSKGDFFNIAQITGLLGQQNLKGKRIPYQLNQGRRSLSSYPLNEKLSKQQKYESRGFIKNSFIHGLNPREFYFHAMTGREGITDTALGTAKSGYQQRKIIKLLEDIQIRYDGTVRNSTGNIYQFIYGNNGMDPSKTTLVNEKHKFCNVKRLVDKLNTKQEL